MPTIGLVIFASFLVSYGAIRNGLLATIVFVAIVAAMLYPYFN